MPQSYLSLPKNMSGISQKPAAHGSQLLPRYSFPLVHILKLGKAEEGIFYKPQLKPNHSPVNTWDLTGWVSGSSFSKLCSSSGGSAQHWMGDGETLRSHTPWLERNQVSYYNHSKWIVERLKDEHRTSEWCFLKSEDIITYFSKKKIIFVFY